MRQIREILRLKYGCGMSERVIAGSVNVARSTVMMTLRRATAAGLDWPLSDGLSDGELEAMVFKAAGSKPGGRRRTEPNWAVIHQEMKRDGVTLSLLWEEYRDNTAEFYGYSRFCQLYQSWEMRLSPTMRQTHVAGEKMFVDYAGHTVPVLVDAVTGKTRDAQIFVAVLGASSFTYAEASWSQSVADWVGSHVNALEYFGGSPRLVVPDNLKSAVVKSCYYDPGLNRTYQEFAAHYEAAIPPARVRKPRDKAKVEVGVQVVERWILARLRNHRFTSLAELNIAIRAPLDDLNDRPMRKLKVSWRQLFEAVERPALRPLPREPYEYAEWRSRKVGLDYHIDIDGHYCSTPYRLVRMPVEARLTGRTVEIFHKGERVAAHLRTAGRGRHTTCPEHMPSTHRAYAGWTFDKLHAEAARIGPGAAKLVALILEHRRHPEQGLRTCLGILGLAKTHGRDRLENACLYGLEVEARTYRSISSILQNNLDRRPEQRALREGRPIDHTNIRGARHYN